MKNFFIICLQLGTFLFALGSVLAIVNWLTGWHISIKGAEVPGDPGGAIVFLVIAGLCFGGLKLLTRSEKKEEPAG